MLVAPAPPPGSKDSSAAVQNHRRLAGHWPRRPTLENSRLDSGGQGGRKLLTISHTSYSQGNYEAQFWRVGIHTFTVFDDITHLPPIRQYRYSLDNYEEQFGRSCSLDTLSLQYLGGIQHGKHLHKEYQRSQAINYISHLLLAIT